jgi:hypothetical protein
MAVKPLLTQRRNIVEHEIYAMQRQIQKGLQWGCPFWAAIFHLHGEFGQKVGNDHVTTVKLPQMHPLSGNLASAIATIPSKVAMPAVIYSG